MVVMSTLQKILALLLKNNYELIIPITNDSYMIKNIKENSESARYVDKSKTLIEWHERLVILILKLLRDAVKNKLINGIKFNRFK